MEKNIKIDILYQYYKDLLSEKQSEAIEQYYLEDLSLTEIAEIQGISKQAVSTNIKRSEKLLLDFESKLKLYSKISFLTESLEDLAKFLKNNLEDTTYKIANERISELIDKLN